jgi:hypothetical protein
MPERYIADPASLAGRWSSASRPRTLFILAHVPLDRINESEHGQSPPRQLIRPIHEPTDAISPVHDTDARRRDHPPGSAYATRTLVRGSRRDMFFMYVPVA